MSRLPEEKEKVKLIYNKPEDYSIVFANGLYGGVSPRGDIHCHFFVESRPLPIEQEFKLSEDGKIGEEIGQSVSPVTIIRDLKVGIIVEPDVAQSIAEWLLDKVKVAKGEKT